MGQLEGAVKSVFFFERSGQIQLFQNEKVIISHHKSTEVVKIVWFSHTTLLLLKKQARKSSEDAQAARYAQVEKVWAG